MQTYIALLRGINVGGHNKIKMAELRELCKDLVLANTQTYIQSGNVIFDSEKEDSRELEELVKQGIAERFGLDVPVLVMNKERLQRVATSNPFLHERNEDIKSLYVAFLQESPTEEATEALTVPNGCSDEFALTETEVFLFYPKGAGRSKLTNNYLEKKLKVAATTRNWKTVNALLDRLS